MKEIQLNQGQVAFVDDADFEMLTAFTWTARWDHAVKKFYVHHNQYLAGVGGKGWSQTTESMAGMITGYEIPNFRNGNTLDHRRENIRPSSRRLNVVSARLSKANTSGFKGVSWCKARQMWEVNIGVNRKKIRLGFFHSAQLAHEAYERAAIFYFGEFANAA